MGLDTGCLLAPSPKARAARSPAGWIIRSCRWRSRCRGLREWVGKELPTEPNGNLPRAAGWTAPNLSGAANSGPVGTRWRTPGRVNFRGRICADGFDRTSPVGASGEWLRPPRHGGQRLGMESRLVPSRHPARCAASPCCVPENPRGGAMEGSYDPGQAQIRIPRKVVKGGSHLCAPNYCRRYRPAARHAADGRHRDEPSRLSLRHS